jgi:hypothetical protein
MQIECSKCGKMHEKAAQKRQCKACVAAAMRAWRMRNVEACRADDRWRYARDRQNPQWVIAERERGKEHWRRLRHEAIMAYGGYKCACCGETQPKFLTIDHVFNDGAKHRRSLGYVIGNGKGGNLVAWLKRHAYPAGFQVLCWNCNSGKAMNGGICPHKSPQANRVNSGEASYIERQS